MSTQIHWVDPDDDTLGVIRLDTVQSTTPEDSMSITDHPVEQGANVVDHAREEPTRFSVEGTVSSIPNRLIDTDAGFQTIELEAPMMLATDPQTITLDVPKPPLALTPSGLIQAAVVGIGEAIFGGPNLDATFSGEPKPGDASFKAQVYQQNVPRNRVRDVYEALLRVQSKRLFCTISTRDRELTDMLIERVAEPRAVEDGGSAKFQVDFKRVRVSASQTVAAPKPTEARGKTGVNKGAQAGTKDEDPKQRRKTLAKVTLDALRSGS
jgi:hypothetical protein